MRAFRRRAVRGGASPGFGIAANRTRQFAQYTPSVPCGHSHNPPHRSQYFSSTWISWPSILPMKFMIASPYEVENIQTNKKAPVPISRPRARFSYDDLSCYLVGDKAVTAAWRLPQTPVVGSNPPRSQT